MKFPVEDWKEWTLVTVLTVAFVLLEVIFAQRVRIALCYGAILTVIICEWRLRVSMRRNVEDEKALIKGVERLLRPSKRPQKRREESVLNVCPGSEAEKYLRRAERAYDSKALIEAHFWAIRAVLSGGGPAAQHLMTRYRSMWVAEGGPHDPGGFREDYTEDCSLISVAVMWLNSGLNVMRAKSRLKRFASAGNEDAAAFLEYLRHRR